MKIQIIEKRPKKEEKGLNGEIITEKKNEKGTKIPVKIQKREKTVKSAN